ncbi:MAG: DUF523 domain-containing protein [Thermodesulfobacteriota bacterium]|nr:DUF523 domain-containing protein [Thermodesulfobacteriota bacterium]
MTDSVTFDPVTIGVSSCLLGNRVRYDGNHSHDHYLTDTFGLFCRFVSVCPEMESGMPVPREPIQLRGDFQNPDLVTRETEIDKTLQMKDWIKTKIPVLEQEDLCGFVFKSKSPSCGLYRVKVFDDNKKMQKNGTGLFARAFIENFPDIPVEESSRLNDPKLREHFIERVFFMQQWRRLLKTDNTLGG